MRDDLSRFLPLSPASLHVLLALVHGELHGYGILLEVVRQSGGVYKMGPGTLYDNLKKLLAGGLVEESGAEGAGRRKYRLSALGVAVLGAEMERLAKVLDEARLGLGAWQGLQGGRA